MAVATTTLWLTSAASAASKAAGQVAGPKPCVWSAANTVVATTHSIQKPATLTAALKRGSRRMAMAMVEPSTRHDQLERRQGVEADDERDGAERERQGLAAMLDVDRQELAAGKGHDEEQHREMDHRGRRRGIGAPPRRRRRNNGYDSGEEVDTSDTRTGHERRLGEVPADNRPALARP